MSGSRGTGPLPSPIRPVSSIVISRRARSSSGRSYGYGIGPGSDSSGSPAARSLVSNERPPSAKISSSVNPKHSV